MAIRGRAPLQQAFLISKSFLVLFLKKECPLTVTYLIIWLVIDKKVALPQIAVHDDLVPFGGVIVKVAGQGWQSL
jgi:hypothetical protein